MDIPASLLLRAKLVDPESLRHAEHARASTGKSLVDVLLAQGVLTPDKLAEALRRNLGISMLMEIDPATVDVSAVELITPERCRDLQVLPLSVDDGATLRLAMVDPTNLESIDDVRFSTGLHIEPVLAPREQIERNLAAFLPEEGGIQDHLLALESIAVDSIAELGRPARLDVDGVADAPIIALVNTLLRQAIRMRASDIHLEPKEAHVKVRYRIDGVLVERDSIPRRHRAAVTARVKILAGLDITERRKPQDGACAVGIEGRRVDFRISTIPTVLGEKLVLRILDGASTRLGFDQLGMPEAVAEGTQRIMRCHEGVFLVTGPTGSGKSTTLYTLLAAMDGQALNIVTLEDPVEYQLASATQCQVNVAVDFTFAAGLRSVLRQDPDVILLGEIRDLETARTAIQASLTGHLVFSTLHTNSAPESILRLHDMGIPTFLLAAGLRGALGQRLARRLCPQCKEPAETTEEIRVEFAEQGIELPAAGALGRAVGCGPCNGIGYRGRMAVYELFDMTLRAQRVLAREPDIKELLEAAHADGYRTMRQDGLRCAAAGITSLEEVYRVT